MQVTELKLIVESQQNVIIPGGNFLCNKVSPVRNDKKEFKNKGEISICESIVITWDSKGILKKQNKNKKNIGFLCLNIWVLSYKAY